MRRVTLAAAVLALACAAPRAAVPPATPPPATSAAPPGAAQAPREVARGMDAAQVRAALGAPSRVERVDSAAAPGAVYERWIYPGDREVVLLDGRVIDVLP